jgi:hypothetical protein
MAVCWAGFLLLFFSFSTTQEYYTVPMYPALALLLGSAMAEGGKWVRGGIITASVIAATGAVAAFAILYAVGGVPVQGDITAALTQNPDAYTLSLGHMQDLTLRSFAWLRWPLLLAGFALAMGAIGVWALGARRGWIALALMMVMLTHAAHIAMAVFDPLLSSRILADALRRAPPGKMIIDGPYYPFSSVFFYADRDGLLWNGRIVNLEYGSYAPGAPPVFIDDSQARALWNGPDRHYLLAYEDALPRLTSVLGESHFYTLRKSGGKALYTNKSVTRDQ